MDTPKTNAPPSPFKIVSNTWNEKKSKLKSQYNSLTDADLQFVEGKEAELTSRIQTRLNKSEVEVQKLISEI